MPSIGIGEIVFVLAVLVLLFGAKRIPEIARGLGSGIRNFKGSIQAGRAGRRSNSGDDEDDDA